MKIRLKDREFEIQPLTLGDWKKLEKKFGGNIQKFTNNMTFEEISYVIYYALNKYNPGLTQEELDELIIPGSSTYKEILTFLGGAGEKNV